MLAISSPFPTFTDIPSGLPLDGGYVYFGVANLNPETNPIQVYWDAAGTQPAPQPLRTVSGYIARAGTPTMVYVGGPYSQTVRNKSNALVFTLKSSIPTDTRTVVNVKDYGATGDGSSDDSVSIQAAIDANPGKVISFSVGRYLISTPLTVRTDNTRLVGASKNSTVIIQSGANADGVQFAASSTATISTFLTGVGFTGIAISRSTASTLGAGLRLTQVNGGEFSDFNINNMPEGLVIAGGQLTNIHDFNLFASGGTFDLSGVSNSCLLKLVEAPIDGGLYQIPYTTNIYGFHIAGSKKIENCILIASADGYTFSDYYIAGGYFSLLKFLPLRETSIIAAVKFVDGYLDGVSPTNGTRYLVYAPDDGFASTHIYSLAISDNFIGNALMGGVLSRHKQMARLNIANNEFVNFPTWPIDIEGSSVTSLTAMGNNFNGFSTTAGAGAIRAKDIGNLSVTGGTMVNGPLSGAAILLSGSIISAAFSGITLQDTSADISHGAATITSLSWAGNSSNNTSLSASLIGFHPGNIQISDSDTMDYYLEGVNATPVVTFGGVSPGVLYGTRNLTYTRVGNRVLGELSITLTNKGTASAGDTLLVQGLPFTHWSSGVPSPCAVRLTSVTAGVGDAMVMAETVPATQTVRLDKMTSGNLTQLTYADLSSTTVLQISFNYPVAP